ncbi:MAG TPA: alpha/beta fold hydrolase [Paracoccaceae bacterium]|nr:alpha/beta fold hydrolase [Paracoccaceae bacterium]HMO71571.1 alpha/beta fold hydrolase [Paracoccaceae bacterium]
MLVTQRHDPPGPATQPPLLIVHGLFGSGRNWGGVARRLARDRAVVTVDQRNHGESPRLSTQTYPDMAADLAAVIGAEGAAMDLLGHSMGGKAAMMLALTRPDLVRRLVVADIAPVAYGHDQTPHIHAMRGLDLAGLDSRAEADRRLAATVPDPALRAFFLQSLDLKAPDGPAWRLNLDALEAEMPRIVGWPEGTTGRFGAPSLFLSGTESRYVLPEHRPAIRALFPAVRFARIPGAGHWLHADRPAAFAETVDVFLRA